MFDDLKLKCRIRQVANNSCMNYDDKLLFYISMFEYEPKKKHDIIKNYIYEFDSKSWEELNEYITTQNMTNIVKKHDSEDEVTKSSTLDEILKKLK